MMEVFVEQAPNYEKCLKKIYDKYGDNITILRKKEAKISKFFGFLESDNIELTFTVNELSKRNPVRPFSEPTAIRTPVPSNDDDERLKIVKGYADKNPAAAEKLQEYLEAIKEKKAEEVSEKKGQDEALQKLLETVERLVTKIDMHGAVLPPEAEHTNIIKVEKLLQENDFGEDYISRLCGRLKNELSFTEIEDFQVVQKKLFAMLKADISIQPAGVKNGTRVILLVGPTGVGKTTTLAKLAAHYVLKDEKQTPKVRVITIDNWRIGAVYQMERYCDVMEIDLTVASNPTEFRAYMDLYREEADVICIDTTGRSPKDKSKLAKMMEYFTNIGEDAEIYLTVCAGTRINDIREIMKQYEIFKFKSLIITKFDETSYIGNILSVISEVNIPVTYLTTGQDVPQDLMPADTAVFLEKLKGFSVEQEYINSLCNH